ncbi:MAG TPA: TetR/AcrR family transcriptional regulator [Verrucomicrobiae bacterium]|nr:TetR/AcrR family transcriptional regulator [Verrucomicrobiae bacterium]
MGRHREFDIEQALRIATQEFWRKGYDNTSISDLTAAMKITAPSFYFAFGSKEGLFQRIVEVYQTAQNRIIDDALKQTTPMNVLRKLLLGFADFLSDPAHPPGCLLLNSSIPVTKGHPFSPTFAEQRRALRLALENRFRQLGREGATLPAGATPAGVAQMVVSLIWGMAVEAQSGAPRSELRKIAATAGRQVGLD